MTGWNRDCLLAFRYVVQVSEHAGRSHGSSFHPTAPDFLNCPKSSLFCLAEMHARACDARTSAFTRSPCERLERHTRVERSNECARQWLSRLLRHGQPDLHNDV